MVISNAAYSVLTLPLVGRVACGSEASAGGVGNGATHGCLN
jgi:hypothetical protein